MGNCLLAPKPSHHHRTASDEKHALTEAWKGLDMKDGDTWNVLSAKWWVLWKRYSGFRDPDEEEVGRVASQDSDEDVPANPGRINNSDIVGNDGELRREISEGEDFILLPSVVYDLLEEWYGTITPRINRTLIQIEDGYRVELFPVVFQCVQALSNGQEPARGEGERKVFHFLPRESLGRVEATISQGYGLSPSSCRIWLKIGDNQEDQTDAASEGEESDGWRLLQHAHRRKAVEWITEDALDVDGSPLPVRCLIEYRANEREEFPRQSGVSSFDEQWRDKLEVGSIIDGLDSDNRWFDSLVIDTNETEVKIHYRGWTSKWDKWVSRSSDDIAPLFTHTEDWRNMLSRGDQIEVSDKVFTGVKKNQWHVATIVKVKTEAVDRQNSENSVNSMASLDPSRRSVELQVDGFENKWENMNSEMVCCVGTHTKKVQRAPSSPDAYSAISSPSNSTSPWAKKAVHGTSLASGTVGLSNLGNTCFMNSMLQCLIQARPLTTYFLEGKHKKDLNKKNPLGTGGKLADAYSELTKKIFSGSYTTVVPRDFKSVLGKFAPQFAGVQQQDSQEFMSFLLDGIHEDLNRVMKKQSTEVVEGGDGKPDDEVAGEAWRRHLLRNDSVVVDNCQGLLKSHLTCPTCGHESITFDPYMSLSLPLPSSRGNKSLRKLPVVIVPLNKDPEAVEIEVISTGTITDLRAAVAKLRPDLEPERLRICDVWSNRVYKVYRSGERLLEIRVSDETYIYEVAHSPSTVKSNGRSRSKSFGTEKEGKHGGVRFVDVLMGKGSEDGTRSTSEHLKGPRNGGAKISAAGGQSSQVELFGAPFHLSFDQRTTCAAMKAQVNSLAARCGSNSDGLKNQKDFTIVACNTEGGELGSELGDGAKGEAQPFGDWLESLSTPKGKNGKSLVIIWRPKAMKMLSRESLQGWNLPRQTKGGSGTAASSTIKLQSCFEHFLEKEQLGEDDLWYCSKCKDHVPAFKKFDLWTAPDILILHLKRFEYIPGQYFMHRQKINALVDFPLENLDLGPMIQGPISEESPAKYDLFGVSEHMGVMGGGHYTAVVKNFKDGKWYGFDDSKVSPASASDACTPNAYVLFYERRGKPSRWAGIKVPPTPLSKPTKE